MFNKNTKILINGCSFTWGQELKDRNDAWPQVLSRKINCDKVVELSSPGKDNFHILNESYHYLLLSDLEDPPVPKVDFLIIQLTDFYRSLIYKKHSSGNIKPNKYQTQLMGRNNFVKINNWNFDSAHSLGSFLTIPHETEINGCFKSSVVPVGDISRSYNNMLTIILLNTIQALCEKLNIKLCIVPYYGLEDWAEDLLFKNIDPSIFLVDTMAKYDALYQEMITLGFNQTDNFHFDKEAHEWQADSIIKFFETGAQIKLSDLPQSRDKDIPDFDYTDE